jgi:hypothetical protein
MRNVKYEHTERGFARVDFDDRYGSRCSLQKSSLAEEDAIWLGQNEPEFHHVTGSALCRMHLTRADVIWLLPMLEHFAKWGELPPAIDATSN